MAMETRKRGIVNYSDLNGLGRSDAKFPKIDNEARVKGYSLNKEKALKKKAVGCLNEFSVSYANKHGNHIFEFSTAMYNYISLELCSSTRRSVQSQTLK